MADVTKDHGATRNGPEVDERNVPFEYPKEGIVSYAQTHEDVLLWRALNSVTPGFYVDIGAHDPTSLSVTRAFYEKGWRGINVEPNPSYAEKLRNARPRDLTLEVGLSDSEGVATIYDFGDTGLSTVVKQIADEHSAAGFQVHEHQVALTTLADVLDELGDQEVHFLKIDVEGYERQVLAGADFTKARPWIVLIESVKPLTLMPTFQEWEPMLLRAGYQFVYFDGLNSYYIANEHIELKRYFSAPVNACDPYRDYEMKQLADSVTSLERARLKHEVPRLGGDTHSCDVSDAAGLLRIVEAQASDLVRLRRALAPLKRSVRLASLVKSTPNAGISEQARLNAFAELDQIQSAIEDLTERSRWRKLGVRLGLAKRPSWETGHWRTDLIETGQQVASSARRRADASAVEISAEIERLNGLLNNLLLSRWRKLGQRIGLAKHLPWESSLNIVKPAAESAEQNLQMTAMPQTPGSNYEGFVELANQSFLNECAEFAVDVILDVGGNIGQFAQGLRAQGYDGHIVSFEPLSDAHAQLTVAAAPDPLWDVAGRCAVGSSDGWAEINIAGNSYSSSLLPMLDLHREAAPHSEYLGKERCPTVTLDTFIEETFSDPTTLFGLKIDTQGYEAEVLAGLKRNHDKVKVVVCEMSLAPLYANGPSMRELCNLLAELNFRCVALSPEFEDPRTGELLQANGVFVKRG